MQHVSIRLTKSAFNIFQRANLKRTLMNCFKWSLKNATRCKRRTRYMREPVA